MSQRCSILAQQRKGLQTALPPGACACYDTAMLARRFLYVIAFIIVLVIAAAAGYRLFGEQLLSAALVPTAEFVPPPARDPEPDYRSVTLWAARPDLATDAARWTPAGFSAAPKPGVAVFFIPPTAIFDRSRWNAPFTDAATEARLTLFLRGEATVFNGIGEIWAPRYRQATFGAFLTDKPQAARAIDLAYRDVARAFAAFLAAQPADRPIILAAHSQGSLHLLRLLKEEVAGRPVARRVIAIYAPGWPISVEADLPVLGFPACATADQTGCILSWLSYARPAEFAAIRHRFDAGDGLAGTPRRGTTVLCVNPLSGSGGAAPALPEANLGALMPNADFSGGALVPKTIGAQCLASGILDIGEPPAGFSDYVLPGNNYHVYDYALFWANLRADVERRVAAFGVPANAKVAEDTQ